MSDMNEETLSEISNDILRDADRVREMEEDAEARAGEIRALAVELETAAVLVGSLLDTSQRCATAEDVANWCTSAAGAVAEVKRLARWSTKLAALNTLPITYGRQVAER